MNWLCGFPFILVFPWNFYLAAESSDCLQPVDARKRPIPFNHSDEATSSIRLPSGTMGIITSYKFHCCGTISSWKTYIYPQGNEHYDGQYNVDFQVWRPSKTVHDDGCYSMVGYSRYSGVLGHNGLVSKILNEPRRIKFQIGDVVGFFVFRIYNTTSDAGRRSGLMLDTSYGEEIVWYHINAPNDPLVIGGSSCPLPVGPKRRLSNFINAAPLLSVQIGVEPPKFEWSAKFPCSAYKGFQLNQQAPLPANISMQQKRSSEKDKKGGWTNLLVSIAVLSTITILIALVVLMAIGALENRKGKIVLHLPPWKFKPNTVGLHWRHWGPKMSLKKQHSDTSLSSSDPIPRQGKKQERGNHQPGPPEDRINSDDDSTQDDHYYLSNSPPPKPELNSSDADNSSHYLSPRELEDHSSQEGYYSPEDNYVDSSTLDIHHSLQQQDGHSRRPKEGHSKEGHSNQPKEGHLDKPKEAHSHRYHSHNSRGHHSHRSKDGHSHRPRDSHHSHQDGHSHRPKDGHQDGHSHRPKDGHQDGHSHRPKDGQDGHSRSHRSKDAHQDGNSHRPKDGQDGHSHRPKDGQDGHSHRSKDAHQDGHSRDAHQDGHSHRHIHSHQPKGGHHSSRHRHGHSHRDGHSHRFKDDHHSRHQDDNSQQPGDGNHPGEGHTADGPSHSRHASRSAHTRRSKSGNHLAPQVTRKHRRKSIAKHDEEEFPQESGSSTGTPNPFPEIPTQVLKTLPAPLTPEPQPQTPQSNKPFILMTPELLKSAGTSSEFSSMPVHIPGSPMVYPQLFTSARSQALHNIHKK